MKNFIKKILTILAKEKMFLKNIFFMIIVSRLLFLEPSQLALVAEILVTIAFIFSGDHIKDEDDE